jgi:hypothetical protein
VKVRGLFRLSVFAALLLSAIPVQAQQSLQVLHHHVRPAVSSGQAETVGPVPGTQRLKLSLVLPLRNQAELTSLLSRLYDPSSPDYHHFLSVDQFTEQFGPAPEDYQAVVQFAKANGFTVTDTPANRLIVPINGSVAQINKAFNLTMTVYQHPTENRTFFSPDREPSLDLSVPVAHIAGMNNFSLPSPAVTRAQEGQAIADITGSGPGGSYLGSDMRAAYYGGTTLTGNGQAVGLLEFGGYNLSDVNATFSNAGQTYSVPINNVLMDGATGSPIGDDTEQSLDIVQAIGLAPGLSQVRVYIGSGQDDAEIFNEMATENIAKQLSCSWGWIPDDPSTDDVFFQEFAAQGQSLFVASGDSGAFDAAISPYFYPAEDSYATTVGGTHLTTNGAGGTWASESAWNSERDGSGGGISPDGIPIPSWQSGVANSSNGGSTTLRNEPDVAMEGDFDNYACGIEYGCGGGWAGTSFAAPRWAGFVALVNQQAVEADTAPSGGVGFLNPAIYSIGEGPSYDSDFHDITSGNNDTDNQPVWYSAVTGYDLVTGWGSANGQNLIDALAGPQVPGFWIAASSGGLFLGQGTSTTTTVTVTDAGGFTGSVNLAVTSTLPSGVTASWGTNPTTGSSVLTLTASSSATGGTANVTITGTSGSLTVTTNFALTVRAPSFTLSASPSYLSLNQSSSATSSITVIPQYGFNSSVNFAASGLPSGVTASWSTNPATGSSVLTLQANSSAPSATATVTITGTSGSLTATTTIALTVYAPTFTLDVGSYQSIIGQGGAGSDFMFVEAQNGFSGNVNMSVSGLPPGVTASFSPNPTTFSTTLTLNVSSTATIGNYTLTFTGTSGSTTATVTAPLQIVAPTFTIYDYGSVSMGQGTSTTSYVYVNPEYGFTGSVTMAVTSGLPSGVTASWIPNPTTGSSTLTLTASSSASLGQYTLTITGTSGTQTATTTLTLGVYVPTFTLSDYSSVTLGQGSSVTSYVYVNPEYGFTGSVTLAVTSGLPSGVTASWIPNPTTGSSTLTLTANSTASLGQYNLTITGTSGTQTATTTLILGVYVPTFTISNYSNIILGQGSSTTSYVYVNSEYGFSGSVTMAITSGLPGGVTASWSPNPTTGYSVLTLTASSSASLGQYNLTITGTSGTQTATATVTLGVYAPTFTLSAGYPTVMQGSYTTSYVYVEPEYGFTGAVNLAIASGLPSGVTASWGTNPTTGSSILTLTATPTASLGEYNVTITGTSGAITATTVFSLLVEPPNFTLTNSPGSLTMSQGGSGTSTVTVNPESGFYGYVTLGTIGLPSGVTASWSTNPTTSTSILTLTASQSATIGTNSVTITGTYGSETATTNLSLIVQSAAAKTVTTLALSSAGNPVTTVTSSSVVTLTATVAAESSAVMTGLVKFCDATDAYCEDSHLLGTAQLTSTGAAVLKFVPSIGSHSYKAVFIGTHNDLTSSSNESALTVTASNPTTTTIAQSGNPGNYTLTATVTGRGLLSPTGTVSFLDTSNGNDSLGAGALEQGQATLSWLNPQSLSTGYMPKSVAVGDFNGDGIPDLAVANNGGNTVTILLGNGDGTFTSTTVSPATGSNPISIASGDFNGDGKADLAIANQVSGTVTILLGNGDGTFTPAASPSTGVWPTSIAVGDFNGDGIPDLAIANAESDTVTILLGNGDGTFTPAASPSTGVWPTSIAVGDFNGDGKLDLAATNVESNTVTILLGNGDGTFTANAVSPPTGIFPESIALGDFNGDGIPDLAVANQDSNTVTILLGKGDGTFMASSVSPATGYNPVSVAVGDFNGDGKSDLAVANYSTYSMTILLGNGDGTFTAGTSAPAGLSPVSIAVSDLNGTGVQDLAVVSIDMGSVTILTSQLTQTATAAGISPGVVGPQLIEASYPGDSNYSSSVSGTTTISAPLATPTVTVTPFPSSITTVQALTVTVAVSDGSSNPTPTGSVMLSGGGYTSAATTLSGGSTTINIPAGSLATATDTLTASYTPDITSSSIYNSATGSNSVTVTIPATPAITWATPAAITYGTALSATQLDASSTVAGTFAYSPTSGTVLSAGPQTLSVTFTPTDTMDYTAATANVTLTVNKATPSISWAPPAAITYGIALSAAQLDAASTVAGTLVYSPAAGIVLSAGPQTLTVTFTPTDATDYTNATASVTLTVNQATPSIAWAIPAPITYGTALSATQLGASTTVPGTFAYSPVSGTVLSAGSQTLSVTFTPTDTTDYTAATKTVSLTVNQAKAAIVWTTPAAITYGTALGAAQLDASSTVAGSFSYSPAAGSILGAGSQTLTVTFTPTDATDYTNATASVTLTVNQAAPLITWAPPAAITYGTALSATQLNASTTVAGTFVYSPVAGTVLSVGTQTLTVTFAPVDTTDYTSTTAKASITINPATPAVKVTLSSSSITTAQALTVTVTVSGGSGNFTPTGSITLISGSYASAATTLSGGSATINVPAGVLAAGPDVLTASYTPDSTSSSTYNTATGISSAITVTTPAKTTPTITWSTPAAIVYGTALSATQLNATASIAGTFSYAPPLGTVLTAGAQVLTASFTPTDTTDYNTASSSVMLTVNKATPAIAWTTPPAVTVGTALSLTQLDATASVVGTFIYSPMAGTVMSTPGNMTLSASFTPTDTTDYNNALATVVLAVNPAAKTTPTVTVTPSATSITTGQALTVTVAVSGGSGNPTPTGSVTLASGTYTSAVAALSSGSALINVPAGSLATGSDTLTILYTPDSTSSSTFNSATGSNSVTVTTIASSSFIVSGTTVFVAAGATNGNTSTISVTPSGGFTGSVMLTAAVTSSPTGAQYPPALSFGTTSPLSIAGPAAGTATLTITTTAATSGGLVYPKRTGVPWYAAGSATLACLLLFGLPAQRRSRRTMIGLLIFLAFITGGVLSCGGGSGGGSGGGGGDSNPGTTAGAYTVTVTGTSGTSTATGTVTLTVQ